MTQESPGKALLPWRVAYGRGQRNGVKISRVCVNLEGFDVCVAMVDSPKTGLVQLNPIAQFKIETFATAIFAFS